MNINQLHLPFCKVLNSVFEEHIHLNQRFDERLYRVTHRVTFRKLESKIRIVFSSTESQKIQH